MQRAFFGIQHGGLGLRLSRVVAPLSGQLPEGTTSSESRSAGLRSGEGPPAPTCAHSAGGGTEPRPLVPRWRWQRRCSDAAASETTHRAVCRLGSNGSARFAPWRPAFGWWVVGLCEWMALVLPPLTPGSSAQRAALVATRPFLPLITGGVRDLRNQRPWWIGHGPSRGGEATYPGCTRLCDWPSSPWYP